MDLITVVNRDASKEEWLRARRRFITSSDAAHILRLGFPKMLKSWKELAEQKRSGARFQPTPKMVAGAFFEEANLRWFSYLTGVECDPNDALLVNPKYPHLGATLDAWARQPQEGALRPPSCPLEGCFSVRWPGVALEGESALEGLLDALAGKTAIVEAKQSVSAQRSKWKKDFPPDYYEAQCRHQMIVAGVDIALLVAKVDAFEVYVHVIERDEVMEHEMLTKYEEFASFAGLA